MKRKRFGIKLDEKTVFQVMERFLVETAAARWWVHVHCGTHVTQGEGPKSGPKHRGGGGLSPVAPEEGLACFGFQAQTATAEITYPLRRDTSTRSF